METVTAGAAGRGDGTVTFSVAPNPRGRRTGTLTIAGQTFTVLQDRAPGAFTTADFNDDGFSDIVWRNYSTGAVSLWTMNGASVLSQTALSAVTDVNWQVVAVADFNQDGRPDLVWRNAVTGDDALWYLDGTTVIATHCRRLRIGIGNSWQPPTSMATATPTSYGGTCAAGRTWSGT